MTNTDARPDNILGTGEHAARLTAGRHPGVVHAMAWLAFSHLPTTLQDAARPFYQTGAELITIICADSAELTTALNKLKEAKDEAVRAKILLDQGRPGPAPRPATVVDPPLFGGNHGPGQPRPRPIRDEPQA